MPIKIDTIAAQQLARKGVTEKTGVYGEHQVKLSSGSPVKLNAIKANSIPYQGFRTATKIERGLAGLQASTDKTLETLRAPGQLSIETLLSDLKTNIDYRTRLTKLGELTPDRQVGNLWMLAPAVERLSNAELAAVYQNLNSAEMTLLETALQRECELQPQATDARDARNQLFDLQALVLKEMSNRVTNGLLNDAIAKEIDADKKDDIESLRPRTLSEQYAGSAIEPIHHDRDITAANLHTLADVAAKSANIRERTAAAETQKLHQRGMDATPREMGDVLRASPLTINFATERFATHFSFIKRPYDPVENMHHKVQRGAGSSRGPGYIEQRTETENLVFPEVTGHDLIPDERPTYGAVNSQRSVFGAAKNYGSTVIILKPEVARRTTFIVDDTFYAPSVKVTPEKREQFFKLLGGSKMSEKTISTFQTPNSEARRALDEWFDDMETKDNLTVSVYRIFPRPINHLFSDGDAEYFATLFIKVFGDASATRQKMATYDNIESLLLGMTDINGAVLAHAAERRARGEDDSVRLATNYIEAQIQGPLIPARDFEEVRVCVDEIPLETREATLREIEQFHRDTGVKITYVTLDKPNEVENIPEEIKLEGINYRVEDNRDIALTNAGFAYFGEHIRKDVEDALNIALENLSDHLRELAHNLNVEGLFAAEGEIFPMNGTFVQSIKRALPQTLTHVLNTVTDVTTTVDQIVAGILSTAFQPAIYKKAQQLTLLNSLNLSEADRAPYTQWILDSPETSLRELQLLIDANRIQKQLDEQLPGVLRQVSIDLGINASFAPQGPILPTDGPLYLGLKDRMGGAIVAALREHLQAYPTDEAFHVALTTNNPAEKYTPVQDAAILLSAAKQTFQSTLQRKAVLLDHLRILDLTDNQRASFTTWILKSKVRTIDELNLAYNTARVQEGVLRNALSFNPPLSAAVLFSQLSAASSIIDQHMAVYKANLPEGREYGIEDKYTDQNRAVTLGISLLRYGNPPISLEQIQALLDQLNAPEMLALNGHLEAFFGNGERDIENSAGFGELSLVRNILHNTRKQLGRQFDRQYDPPLCSFDFDPKYVPKSSRNLFAHILETHDVVPGDKPPFIAEINRLYPPVPFPEPYRPDRLPQNQAQRRTFLLNHLDTYLQHENTFDTNAYHGRGHITRAFIFGSVLCSILEENGIPIDRNAVLCGITGHDSGRRGNGPDQWEITSAGNTTEYMKADFGRDALGGEYEKAMLSIITNRNNPTAERMVFQSADALDIGRLGSIDPSRIRAFRHLNPELVQGIVAEVETLQRLTYAPSTYREALTALSMEGAQRDSENDVLGAQEAQQKRANLEAEIVRSLAADRELSSEEFVAKFENTIRNNANLFPILNKYYFQD